MQDILVRNVSMSNATDGARIKVWPGVQSALSGDLQGGGGSGMVKDVVYDGMTIANVDYGIEITGCYGQSNLTLCNEFPVGFPPFLPFISISVVQFSHHFLFIATRSFLAGPSSPILS